MEAKIKSGTFLAESCGRASNHPLPPTAPPTQKYHFFYAAPKGTIRILQKSQNIDFNAY